MHGVSILFSYPWVFKHTRSDDEVKDRTKHCHDTNKHKYQVSIEETDVYFSTCEVEGFYQSIGRLFYDFQIEFWINYLIPYEGYPCAGYEKKQECVYDHIKNPQNNMRSRFV